MKAKNTRHPIVRKALALLQVGQEGLAKNLLKSAFDSGSNPDTQIAFTLGRILALQGQWLDAAHWLGETLKFDPYAVEALVHQARVHERLENSIASKAYSLMAYLSDSTNERARSNVRLAFGDMSVRQVAEAVSDLYDELPTAAYRYMTDGWRCEIEGFNDQALSSYERVLYERQWLNQRPNVMWRLGLTRCHVNEGAKSVSNEMLPEPFWDSVGALEVGGTTKALTLATAQETTEPGISSHDCAEAYRSLALQQGRQFKSLGKWTKSIAWFDDVLNIDPYSMEALVSLSEIHAALENCSERRKYALVAFLANSNADKALDAVREAFNGLNMRQAAEVAAGFISHATFPLHREMIEGWAHEVQGSTDQALEVYEGLVNRAVSSRAGLNAMWRLGYIRCLAKTGAIKIDERALPSMHWGNNELDTKPDTAANRSQGSWPVSRDQNHIRFYQSAYATDQLANVDEVAEPFDNTDNPYPELREYYIMKCMHRDGLTDHDGLTGLLSPTFVEKTGVTNGSDFVKFVAENPGQDLYLFSSFPENSTLFWNVWRQGEACHEGLLGLARLLFERAGINFSDLHSQRMGIRESCYSNFWAGNKMVWDRFVTFADNLLGDVIGPNFEVLQPKYFEVTDYHTPVSFFPFIFERLISSFIVLNPDIKVAAFSVETTDERGKMPCRSLRTIFSHLDDCGNTGDLRILFEKFGWL